MFKTPYQQLLDRFKRMDRFAHLSAIVGWDQAAMMPDGGAEPRAEAIAELEALRHELMVDPANQELLRQAEQMNLRPQDRASLREIKADLTMATALPEELVRRKSELGSRCEHAWRSQRQANDWQGFLKNFEPVVEASREEAQRLSQKLGVAPYDALMERFEPGIGSAAVERLFGSIASWLPGVIQEVQSKQRAEADPIQPEGPFDIEKQRQLGRKAMELLGFDFNRGRLDVSAHPFCGGVPSDVRITTHYNPQDCLSALMGVVHETGHALYEQGLPQEWAGLPVGRARSMAAHESQSLLFEMQVGAHPGFIKRAGGWLAEAFGAQRAFEPDNLIRLVTRVEPGLIRIQADEVTYPAHVALRFEIEKALIEGAIEAKDIPTIWDARMMTLLGVDTRGNYKDGPMQDIHWTDGSFGYFPSYTMGALLAAQLMRSMRQSLPVDDLIEAGDFAPIRGWLADRVWSKASLLSTSELIKSATGSELSDLAFKEHIRSRYLGEAPKASRAARP